MTQTSLTEEEIFQTARRIDSGDARRAYLDQACGDNTALRQQVDALLVAHAASGSFLESPASALMADSRGVDRDHLISEGPGTQIGPYKLLEQIGEGGFGVVFVAEQERPVRRRVALKIAKPGMDTRQVIARFEAERQALAMMDHPNIAKVFDAGATDTGRPYFVMELVKGVPITDYCDQHQLTPRQRLELFMPVCQAVQHAHQKGIIHRDIKPSNVLVARYDDKPVPKIIDFGVAKATEQRLTERTLFTQHGQIVGTMEYMSPEQAQFNQLDVDTRTDVYSLGVLLYELLSGETPFDRARLRSVAFDEMLRVIREEEPPRPSLRLSTSDSLPSIAANRQIEPRKLSSLVRGELDWIVMKALEKDRSRRYETANGLAADINRYLEDEPVTACPPTAVYRLRKLARRHKVALAVTAATLLILIGAVVLLTTTNVRVRRASSAKDAALATAREAVDQMLRRVGDETLINVPLAQPLRKALLEDALKFYEGFVEQAKSDPSVRFELAKVLHSVSNIQRELGRDEDARNSQERSLKILRSLMRFNPAEPTYREQLASGLTYVAFLLSSFPTDSSDKETETYLREALDIFSNLEQDYPNRPQDNASCWRWLADIMVRRGDIQEAVRLYRQAIARDQSAVEREPLVGNLIGLSWDCNALAENLSKMSPPDRNGAEQLIVEAIAAADRALTVDPDSKSASYVREFTIWSLCKVYADTDRVDEAIALLRESLPRLRDLCTQDPWTSGHWSVLSYSTGLLLELLQDTGHRQDATEAIYDTCTWLDGVVPHIPDDVSVQAQLLLLRIRLGMMLQSAAQLKETLEFTRDVLERNQRQGEELADTPEGRISVATVKFLAEFDTLLIQDPNDREQVQEALQAFEQAAESFNQQVLSSFALQEFGDYASLYVTMAKQLATESGREEKLKVVEAQLMALYASLLTKAPPREEWYRERIGHRLRNLGFDLQGTPYQKQSEKAFRDAAHVWEDLVADYPDVAGHLHYMADTYRSLGNVLAQSGRPDKAEPFYKKSLAVFDEHDDLFSQKSVNNEERARSLLDFAAFLASDARPSEAEQLFDRGYQLLRQVMVDRPLSLQNHYLAAVLQVRQGDLGSYRTTCRALIGQFGHPDTDVERDRLAWTCALGPEALADLSVPLEQAQVAVEAHPQNAGYLGTMGALLYRIGRFEEAESRLDESIAAFEHDTSGMSSICYSQLFLAMSLRRRGDQQAARQVLTATLPGINEALQSPRTAWNRRATLELLRSEANGLIVIEDVNNQQQTDDSDESEVDPEEGHSEP